VRKLAVPVPARDGRAPMDPGRPLLQRPAALGLLLPIALLALIAYAVATA